MAASIARRVEKATESVTGALEVETFHDLYEAARRLDIERFAMTTAGGRLVITGAVRYQVQKDRFWRAVKQHDGWETRVVVDVQVTQTDIRGYHTVEPGETLDSIAELYFGSARRAGAILDANRDRLNDFDQIFPGQQLVIPAR